MGTGKDICNLLKQIRQQLADENGIVYNPKECHHEGDCMGTCPKCESETRYIEQQLSLRKRAGNAIKIVGLAAGVATISANMSSCIQTDGDINDPDYISFVYDSCRYFRDLQLNVPKEGGTFQCSCDALYPNVKSFRDSLHDYQPCLLDEEGKPVRIVKRCIDQEAVPVVSEDSVVDLKDIFVDWIKVKSQTDNNIFVTVEPNKGSNRSIWIAIVDKNSLYGYIQVIQEGE
ncbi:MAG: hypothetical protein J6Y37_18315 [Paludibacteraceae bacterium]|nr:hypothetical protein [Paludibacteraceae bacterium]